MKEVRKNIEEFKKSSMKKKEFFKLHGLLIRRVIINESIDIESKIEKKLHDKLNIFFKWKIKLHHSDVEIDKKKSFF